MTLGRCAHCGRPVGPRRTYCSLECVGHARHEAAELRRAQRAAVRAAELRGDLTEFVLRALEEADLPTGDLGNEPDGADR